MADQEDKTGDMSSGLWIVCWTVERPEGPGQNAAVLPPLDASMRLRRKVPGVMKKAEICDLRDAIPFTWAAE